MKKVLLLTIALLFAIPLWAKDGDNFEYNGINYTVISEADKTCGTKAGTESSPGHTGLSGELNLTSIVYNNEISYTLTKIGDYSFNGCSGLTGNLIIPESVTSIGTYAFRGCSGFDGKLTLPENLTKIGSNAFYYCSGLTGDLTIPEGVTEISSRAFAVCSRFKGKLTLPKNLTSIGDFAFHSCSGLTGDLTIPEDVTEIGNSAFEQCSGFNGKLTLPENLTSIGEYAFSACYGLTGDLTIPEGVTEISSRAFAYCYGFNGKLTLPENLTSIGDFAFYRCLRFGKLTLPENLTTIGSDAFYECSGLTGDLTIPEGVTKISSRAFAGCSGFEKLTLPKNLTSIDEFAFAGCSGFGKLTLPENLTSIGRNAFYNCSGLTGDLTIPDGVRKIDSYAFYNCSGLTGDLTIPDGVTKIFSYTFSGCSGFNGKLTLPKNLTSIDDSAFSNCKFSNVVTWADTPPVCYNSQVFEESIYSSAPLYVPAGSIDLYKEAPVWEKFYNIQSLEAIESDEFEYLGVNYQIISRENKTCRTKPGTSSESGNPGISGSLNIPEKAIHPLTSNAYTVIEIGDYSFQDCKELKGDLIIPNFVTVIGKYAFRNCSGLTGELAIPQGVTKIKSYAFYGCKGFTGDLIIPEGIIEIDYFTFYDCSGFNGELKLPVNLTSINPCAFSGCSSLKGELKLPNKLISIGSSAFSECSSFEGNLIIPEGITKIEDYTFWKCYGLDGELQLPSNLSTIGKNSFALCRFQSNLKLPNTLTSIGEKAFSNCIGFTGDLIIPNEVKEIKNGTFEYCIGFNGNLKLPKNLTIIEKAALSGCEGLKGDLIIPESVTEIGEQAFWGCASFNGDLKLPDGLTQIGHTAFYSCMFNKVISNATLPPVCADENVFSSNIYTSAPLIVPTESVQKYKDAPVWENFNQIKANLPAPESITLTSVSQEGTSDKTNLKQTEELYFTVALVPADADFDKINWSAEPDGYIDFIDTGDGNGFKVTAKMRENVTAENVVITATVDDTDISAQYTVSIAELIPGDANDSGEVNVADVGVVAREVLKQDRTVNFCYVQANVIADKEINSVDLVATINITLGKDAGAVNASRIAAANYDFLRADDFNGLDKEIEMGVDLDNASRYVVLQTDMILPEGMEVVSIQPGPKAVRHELQYNMIDDNVMRIILYSLGNDSFADNAGVLFTVKANATTEIGDVIFANIIAADSSIISYNLDFAGGRNMSDTGIGNLNPSAEDSLEIFNLQGIKVKNSSTKLSPGIYIINGKKMHVK